MGRPSRVAAKRSQAIHESVKQVSQRFAAERGERQRRRELVPADFALLREAGFLLTAVPVDQGGVWESVSRSIRPTCEILRTLAHGDPSVALVASMHPAVLSFWLATPQAPEPFCQAWEEQRRWAFQTACDGLWWGTIVSEPGSGGDTSKTRAVALPGPTDGQYRLTGQKHFGSGSGITSFMVTNALPAGDAEPDRFFMDVRGVPWDGSTGVKLVAAWDGHGMTATQSHAMAFEDFPAMRSAWPGGRRKIQEGGSEGFGTALFTAVVVGVVETAIETARHYLKGKRASMRAYEQVEWSRVELEVWLIHQAYQGLLRAAEEDKDRRRSARLGKMAVAGLAESALLRICKVVGGSSYSRHSPFGFWLEDVRALGFLRPPWGLAYDTIFEGSWDSPA